jgi:hypothetical protein
MSHSQGPHRFLHYKPFKLFITMAKKQNIVDAEKSIDAAAVKNSLAAKSANRTKFWTPSVNCVYRIKDADNNLMLEYNLDTEELRTIDVTIDYLIPFLFADQRAEDWSQAHSHEHNDLADDIYLGWIQAVPYSVPMYRLKKTSNPRQGQLYSEGKDQYYTLVEARGAYQWQPYSFD